MTKIANQRRTGRLRRHSRVRKKIHGTAERPRLSLYRSNKHLILQVIDDDRGVTIASASSVEATVRQSGGGSNVAAAARLANDPERIKAMRTALRISSGPLTTWEGEPPVEGGARLSSGHGVRFFFHGHFCFPFALWPAWPMAKSPVQGL